jgi:hypothetical protein
MTYERARVDGRRNPTLGDGEVRYLLARRLGRVAGRLLVHEDGRFGCFDAADEEAALALLAAAPEAARGPVSFADEVDGALVDGFDVAGATGRPWHPPWLATALEAAGFERSVERPMWRLDLAQPFVRRSPAPGAGGRGKNDEGQQPLVAGPHGDRRLVLAGIAAVPDLAPGLRDARGFARRARRAEWETAVIVRVDGVEAELVPDLMAAAADAGYRSVLSPWTPDPAAPPETIHAVYQRPTTEIGADGVA